MSNFWMVRAGERGVLARAFEQQGCVAIGWGETEDLGSHSTQDAVRGRIDATYPDQSVFWRGQAAGQVHRFRSAIASGDRIVTFDSARREYLVGTVRSTYEYRPGHVAKYPHVRQVSWEGRVPRDVLRQASRNTLGSLLSVFALDADVLADVEDALRTSRPTPAPPRPVDARRLERLFGQFEHEYLSTDAGQRHQELYEAGRAAARANFEEITRRADAGEDVTGLVLSKLLPHTDSLRHREQGDWIHVAPAITGDIRSWYERAGWATPEEWPERARLILRFVRRAVEHPGELAAACSEFTTSPHARGMQGGMLTPILSALRPEEYALVNSKVCELLEALTGERGSSSLADYRSTNALILSIVESNRDVFGRAAVASVSSLEAFDMMSHWYVAVRQDGDEGDVPGGPGRRTIDRESAVDARQVVEALCPDAAPRAVVVETFVRSLKLAHSLAPSSWSVTLKPRLCRLNVGGILAVDIGSEGLYLVVQQDMLDRRTRRRLDAYERGNFNYLPAAVGYLVPFDELDPALATLRPAHEELIRRVTQKTDKAPFKIAHSPGILAMLRQAGHDVPEPGWSGNRSPVPVSPPGVPKRPEPKFHPDFTLEQAAAETHLDTEVLAAWVRAINRKGQAILYGPPGTGKTYVAERLRQHLLSGGDGHTDLVQFHPAYAYEDFIQGLRPSASSDGRLTYEMMPGRFVEFCGEAAARSGVSVLVIDEINRANLAQVFGELMYLLEYRDRDLPLAGGRRLRIPPNVRIIGTMNTADRSIALVDHALRRRFAFLRLDPNAHVLRRFHARFDRDVSGLTEVLGELNGRIADPHYAVGISFFLRETLAEDLEAIWTGEIEPYVEELFWDRKPEVDRFRWAAVKGRVQQLPIA